MYRVAQKKKPHGKGRGEGFFFWAILYFHLLKYYISCGLIAHIPPAHEYSELSEPYPHHACEDYI